MPRTVLDINVTDAPQIMCCGCSTARQSPLTRQGECRLPRGWKRLVGSTYCPKCRGLRYRLRAVAVPIGKPLGITWAEFHAVIREQWSLSSQCMTWMIREMYARDVMRERRAKMPPMPKVYLYPEARERFPRLSANAVSQLEQLAQSRYRAHRRGVMWTLDEQLQIARYPQPYMVPAKDWSVDWSDDARKDAIVNVRIGDRRYELRLRGGKDFARQRKSIAEIIDGSARQGSLEIYRKRCGGDNRNGTGIERGETQRVKYEVMVKIVGDFPREDRPYRSGVLHVRSDSDSLLVALDVKDERLFVVNADHVRRWCAEHARRLNRWSDDHKFEHRPTALFADRRQAAARKFRNRVHSFCQMAAAQLVGYAVRRKFAEIKYDDTDRRFVDRFDWSGLKLALAQKCDAEQIVFSPVAAASGDVQSESPSPLEGDT